MGSWISAFNMPNIHNYLIQWWPKSHPSSEIWMVNNHVYAYICVACDLGYVHETHWERGFMTFCLLAHTEVDVSVCIYLKMQVRVKTGISPLIPMLFWRTAPANWKITSAVTSFSTHPLGTVSRQEALKGECDTCLQLNFTAWLLQWPY